MERLTQSAHGHLQGDGSFSATLTIAEETSQMAIDDNSSADRQSTSEGSSPMTEEKTDFLSLREPPIMYQTKQLTYLAHSYNRTLNEEKNYPKVSNNKLDVNLVHIHFLHA